MQMSWKSSIVAALSFVGWVKRLFVLPTFGASKWGRQRKEVAHPARLSPDPQYFAWLVRHQWRTPALPKVAADPLFSVLMPVYNTEPAWLCGAVDSVLRQSFSQWELVVCDDASSRLETVAMLDNLAQRSARLRVLRHPQNAGISAATNTAAAVARGRYLVLLDHDDCLDPDALATLAARITADGAAAATVYYSDEDRLSPTGVRYRHHFKPGFSPSQLETHNYLLHLLCIDNAAFQAVGGMRSVCDGSQDYDLLLRLLNQQAQFAHVPAVLYSWGESATSMVGGELKPYVFEAGKRALREYFAARGEAVSHIADAGGVATGLYQSRFILPDPLHILLIRYASDSAPFDLPLPSLPACFQIRELVCPDGCSPLAFAQHHCTAATQLLLFLRAGLEPLDWTTSLQALAGWALRPSCGLVAGQVQDNRGRLRHAGLSLLPSGQLQADFYDLPQADTVLAWRLRDCLAVAGLWLALTPARLQQLYQFRRVGKTSFCFAHHWDIALSLRAHQLGLRVVYQPQAVAQWSAHLPYAPLCLPSAGQLQIWLQQAGITHDPYLNPQLISAWNDARLAPSLPADPTQPAPIGNRLPLPAPIALPIQRPLDGRPPRFSLILATDESNLAYLRELLESIHAQSFADFEVCLSDAGSSEPRLRAYLASLTARDGRFRVFQAEQRTGIVHATNRSLAEARGTWLVFCDQADRLVPHALQALAAYAEAHPDTDLIYSDEDLLDAQGHRHSPHYRPDWNPDLLLSQLYFPHLVAVKRTLAARAGATFDPALEGAQDYDFYLRTTELAQHIGHIPEILYSRRYSPATPAQESASTLKSYAAGRLALERALARRGEVGTVTQAPGTALGIYRVQRPVSSPVSHILAVEQAELATAALRSLSSSTGRAVEQVVVLAQGEEATGALLQAQDPALRLVFVPAGSNLAAFYNAGAQQASAAQLIFSSAAVELLDSDYPDALIEHSQRPGIGAVGARLIYPNGFFYHTGLLLGVNGACGYAHRNLWQGPGYWYYAAVIRNYSAVSWDLLAVSQAHWAAVGGFDDSLPAFADVDFCLKLGGLGLRQVYTPYVCGVLKQGVHSLEELQHPEAAALLRARHGARAWQDPCYHPRLSTRFEDFSQA